MAAPKGHPKWGGRKKGTPNKATAELGSMIDQALTQLGGVDYLVEQGAENPVAFMALIGKRLPRDVNLQAEIAARVLIERSFVKKP